MFEMKWHAPKWEAIEVPGKVNRKAEVESYIKRTTEGRCEVVKAAKIGSTVFAAVRDNGDGTVTGVVF